MLSVVVAAWGPVGNPYSAFVSRWWAAIERMRPNPAEVVVVHTEPEPLGLLAAAPAGIAVRSVPIQPGPPVDFWNAGVEAASQPWVSTIGVDDCYRSDALALLAKADAAGAEIMVWHHQERGGHVWHTFWNPEVLKRANTVQGASPFRRELWQRVGGYPPVGWCDWGLWLRCAKAGATVAHTQRIGVDFDIGDERETFSGRSLKEADRIARDAEIDALVDDLFGVAAT
jgi:hypothetical protein